MIRTNLENYCCLIVALLLLVAALYVPFESKMFVVVIYLMDVASSMFLVVAWLLYVASLMCLVVAWLLHIAAAQMFVVITPLTFGGIMFCVYQLNVKLTNKKLFLLNKTCLTNEN